MHLICQRPPTEVKKSLLVLDVVHCGDKTSVLSSTIINGLTVWLQEQRPSDTKKHIPWSHKS